MVVQRIHGVGHVLAGIGPEGGYYLGIVNRTES
jgi:hypothetical protein